MKKQILKRSMAYVDNEESPTRRSENIDIENISTSNSEIEEEFVCHRNNCDVEENPLNIMDDNDIAENPMLNIENIDFEDSRDLQLLNDMRSSLSRRKEKFTSLLQVLGELLDIYNSIFYYSTYIKERQISTNELIFLRITCGLLNIYEHITTLRSYLSPIESQIEYLDAIFERSPRIFKVLFENRMEQLGHMLEKFKTDTLSIAGILLHVIHECDELLV
ncbi:unnamed protein product [Larinioides sclopetarius]|uniref:Uncharacterized protein n=1 Tax=Larinioides sclopetarius TaxID=280406 RepID=A0AAV2BMT3_9ARAC